MPMLKKNWLRFYQLMDYPLPRQWNSFIYHDEIGTAKPLIWSRHRDDQTELLDTHIALLRKRIWIWRRVPFVEAVYLSGPSTFNACQGGESLDLVVVTSIKRLWTARLCSMVCRLFARLIHPSTSTRVVSQVWMSTQATNLIQIRRAPYDPYLVYWLAHLVTLYQRHMVNGVNIRHDNAWINEYLPQYGTDQQIDMGIVPAYGKSRLTRARERLLAGRFGWLVEFVSKMISFPYMLAKRATIRPTKWTLVINGGFTDMFTSTRKLISLKRKMMARSESSSEQVLDSLLSESRHKIQTSRRIESRARDNL